MEREIEKKKSAKAAKSKSNKDAYAVEKQTQERALLRLEKGSLAEIDRAAEKFGLSRSAFMRLYLAPCLLALGARLSDIDKARSADGRSVARFMADAIGAELGDGIEAKSTDGLSAAMEFDLLFDSSAVGDGHSAPGAPGA